MKPNRDLDHIHVIIRFDDIHGLTVPLEQRIAVAKALWSLTEAEAEVARLNTLNASKGVVYFSTIARLQRTREGIDDLDGE